MDENFHDQMGEYLKNIESVTRAALEQFELQYLTSDLLLNVDFIDDMKEIAINCLNQTCKRFEIELKLKNSKKNISYASTLKSKAPMESESEDVNNLKVGDEMSESNADDNKTDLYDTASVSSSRADLRELLDPLDELKGQRTLLNCIYIFGISQDLLKQAQTEQFRMNIFRKLCKKIKVKVSEEEVEETFIKKNSLIIKMHRMADKEKVLDCAEDRDVWTNDLYELPRGQDPLKIKICHFMTSFYSRMWFKAEKFKNQGRLHSFKLTNNGLVVVRKKANNEKIILSEQQLIDYINI